MKKLSCASLATFALTSFASAEDQTGFTQIMIMEPAATEFGLTDAFKTCAEHGNSSDECSESIDSFERALYQGAPLTCLAAFATRSEATARMIQATRPFGGEIPNANTLICVGEPEPGRRVTFAVKALG